MGTGVLTERLKLRPFINHGPQTMSRPLTKVATGRRAEQKKKRSRHHLEVATWNKGGKEKN